MLAPRIALLRDNTGGFVPKLHATGMPSIGNANFAIQLFDGSAGGLALCTLGLSDTVWGGGALPFPLGGGCSVLVDPLMALMRPITGTAPGDGRADLPLGVPNDPTLVGGALFTQWLTLDPAAPNPFALVTSSGMQIRIQL